MPHPIINVADVELQACPPPPGSAAKRFEARLGRFSTVIGAVKLGYNITAVPPGKRAFPFHCHHFNEEMFFVLEGAGEMRFGTERFPIRTGDVIACPPGGPERAHQIINTGTTELRYLAVSTKETPEICEYPDSGKFAVMADYKGVPEGGAQGFRIVSKPELSVDYWDEE